MLFAFGCIFFIVGITLKIRIKKTESLFLMFEHGLLDLVDRFASQGLLGRILDKLIGKSNTTINRFYSKLLDESNTKKSIHFIVFLKFIVVIIVFFLIYIFVLFEYPLEVTDFNKMLTRLSFAFLQIYSRKLYLAIIFSFVGPEIFLFVKWLLLGSRYKRDAIRIENIFELLGGINGFGSLQILEELTKVGGAYQETFKGCYERFITNKSVGLEYLKLNARNKRFSGICDAFRVYTFSDHEISMQMLERQRSDFEEGALMTMEEDMDVIDIVAFISMAPILYELANLVILPMLNSINNVFSIF